MGLSEIRTKLEEIIGIKPNDKLTELINDCILICSDAFDYSNVDRIDDSIISVENKKELKEKYLRINLINDPEKRYKELSEFYGQIKQYFYGSVSDELINIGVYSVKKKDWRNIRALKNLGGLLINDVFKAL